MELEGYLTEHENEMCGTAIAKPGSTFGNGGVQLEQLADEGAAFGRVEIDERK